VLATCGLAVLVAAFAGVTPVSAQTGPGADDNLNATLWTQKSVEFKASAMAAYKLAQVMLDQALADSNWTAADEQSGSYQNLPPAVILDVDETVLDNQGYQAWAVVADSGYPKNWSAFVDSATSKPIPGSLEFARYADSKGVKVFYVSNRKAPREPATRKNLEAYGYPMGGNVDTVLLRNEQDGWGSKKSTRRAHVAKDYRILLLVGDNFGDFTDGYKQTNADRVKLMEANKDRWGTKWIMIANPTYGSWEQTPFGFNYKLSTEEKRQMKRNALQPWKP
jgi:acid phosphatase